MWTVGLTHDFGNILGYSEDEDQEVNSTEPSTPRDSSETDSGLSREQEITNRWNNMTKYGYLHINPSSICTHVSNAE